MAKTQRPAKNIASPNSQTAPTAVSWLQNIKLHYVLLFLSAFLLYGNTLKHQFALDDGLLIWKNTYTQRGFAGMKDILSHDSFHGFFKENQNFVSGGRYRPLTMLMFAAENQLFGTEKAEKDAEGYTTYEYSPFVGHFINVLLYGLICVVLYRWLLFLFHGENKTTQTLFPLLITLLFAYHPIHTEAVANIKGRDELVALLLSLLAAITAWKSYTAEKFDIKNLPFCLAAFFLALFAKETPVTFLAVIPLSIYLFAPEKNIAKLLTNIFLPLLGITLVWWFAIRGAIVGSSVSAETVNELMNNPFLKIENGQYVAFTFPEKLATIFYTWLKYLQLLLIPHPLTSDYYPYQIPLQTFGSPTVLLSSLIHVAALVFAGYSLVKQKYSPLVFGILYYFLTFSVVSNLVFPIGTAMGERFMFMPSIGAMCLLAWAILRISSPKINLSLGIVGIICALFFAKTISRNADWYDNLTLFQADVKTSANSAKINNGLAGMLMEKVYENGVSEQEQMNYASQALPYFEKAIQIHPNYTNAWLLKGDAHYYRKEYDAALTCYQEVKRQNPQQANIGVLMGTVYASKGRVLGEQKGDVQGAVAMFEKALEHDANNEEALRLLGIAYGQQKQFEKAATYFEKYNKVTVNKAWGLYYLGSIYKDLGKIAQGDSLLQAAYQLDASLKKK